jgi:putative flavoprotein involved in K+ transport
MTAGTQTNLSNAEVLVVGAGPAGLAAAKCLADSGHKTAVIDQFGVPGGAYQRMYGPLQLSSPTRYLSLPEHRLKEKTQYTTAERYARYLAEYADKFRITITRDKLLQVQDTGLGALVRVASGTATSFRHVIIATGMCDSPVWPAIGGLSPQADSPTIIHAQDWPGPKHWKHNARLLIIGAGMRAIELAEECAASGLHVTLSRRAPIRVRPQKLLGVDLRYLGFPLLTLLPPRFFRSRCRMGPDFPAIDRGIKKFVAAGAVKIAGPISRIEGCHVAFEDGVVMTFDGVVVAAGYRYAMPFLESDFPVSDQGYPLVRDGHNAAAPNIHFVGIPCAFRLDSQFIHGIARDAHLLSAQITTTS